jgi:transposase-like protein
MPEVNEAVVATYLAGGNTRRIRGALRPLLKAAPLSKSAVSRVVATQKDGLEAWQTRSLADLGVIYLYLDGFALRVRSAGKVVSVPILGVVGVLPDGRKHLLARAVRRRVVRGVEGLPRRSRRARVAGAGALHHRR